MQFNQFVEKNFDKILLGGKISFPELECQIAEDNSIAILRKNTEKIDTYIQEIIKSLVENNNIPIVIGGGHNNSYGIISGVSKSINQSIEVLNIDPHLDFRALEGRHSGNGFSYSYYQNYIAKYFVWGYHQAYNNQEMLNKFNQTEDLQAISLEELEFENSNIDLFQSFIQKLNKKIGFELDMDSICRMGASAYNPTGFTENTIRNYLYKIMEMKDLHYIHIAEGAPNLDSNPNHVAKFLAYLIYDILVKWK